eukprot:TRINITY_DN5258_c0_g1_i2.p1 TRINITY_DN5258_c0_g1~~TRINITY_DN5258_c0_g1_i2.p1  ORF type:complete len:124 (+),score=26.01 TRINITY_DN5258_c0_g1_i2:50-421(+)
MADDEEVFSFDQVMALVDNCDDIAMMMLSNFLETERNTLDRIVEEGSKPAEAIDWKVLRTAAHSLKGSSSYLFANIVKDLSYDMQKAAEAQDKNKVDELLPSLVQEFDRATAMMQQKLTELGG